MKVPLAEEPGHASPEKAALFLGAVQGWFGLTHLRAPGKQVFCQGELPQRLRAVKQSQYRTRTRNSPSARAAKRACPIRPDASRSVTSSTDDLPSAHRTSEPTISRTIL